jgi:transposase-like protein
MDKILKDLEGKNLSKRQLFDFLANLDFAAIVGKKEPEPPLPPPKPIDVTLEIGIIKIGEEIPVIKKKRGPYKKTKIKPSSYTCDACLRTFTVMNSLRRHHKKFPECVTLISLGAKAPVSSEPKPLPNYEKGIHLCIPEIINMSMCGDALYTCRHCNTSFSSKSNFNKHFTTSHVCNKLAFIQFKQYINSI